jgi:Amt family ammonium transporter
VISAWLGLDDPLAVISVHGLGGIWGLLAVGVFATGYVGAGWNCVGAKEYLGSAAQGITGLLPAGQLAADPGQMQAQVLGALAISLWALALCWVLLRLTWRPDSVDGRDQHDETAATQAEA